MAKLKGNTVTTSKGIFLINDEDKMHYVLNIQCVEVTHQIIEEGEGFTLVDIDSKQKFIPITSILEINIGCDE